MSRWTIKLYIGFFLLNFCSKTYSVTPAHACLAECNRNFYFCLILIKESLPKADTPAQQYDNNTILSGACDPGPCKSSCYGQALATSQQNRR